MGFFSSLDSSLKKTLKKATNWVEGAAKTVANTAKPVVNTVYGDSKSVVSWVANQAGKTADTYYGIASNLGNSTAGLITNTEKQSRM